MLFLFWWCFDDHLAAALETPGLGELPLWVPFLMTAAFYVSPSRSSSKEVS